MTRRTARLLLVVVALGGLAPCGGPASSKEGAVTYGPVPVGLAAILANENEVALAGMALDAIDAAERGGVSAARLRWARTTLSLLGEYGLRVAAERLATNRATDLARGQLLSVLAAGDVADVDPILLQAAGEPLPGLRMIAAQGLARGRTPAAVPGLAKLARDPRSGVRAAALRALFAIPGPHARAARVALPEDTDPMLHTERLRRHRLARDHDARLADMAHAAFQKGRDARLRTEAAYYLSLPGTVGSPLALEMVIAEFGASPEDAVRVRNAYRYPTAGYDLVLCRRVAIRAALTLLGDNDATEARRLYAINQAVFWLADPVPMDAYRRDPIPEARLRQRLPDFGVRVIPATTDLLRRNGFYIPEYGIALLRELGIEHGRPALVALLEDKRAVRLQTDIAYAIVQLGSLGDEALARRLLGGPAVTGARAALVEALRGDDAAWAIPLLKELLEGDEPWMVTAARRTLQQRPEPEARKILLAHVFANGKDVEDHLPPLLRHADDLSFETLARALDDPRRIFRHEARMRLANRTFRGARGLALVRKHADHLRDRGEIEDHIYALLNQDPEGAVAFVRRRWDTLDKRLSALKQLQEVWGTPARKAAVDLALEKAKDATDPLLLSTAGAVLSARTGHRDPEIEAHWRRMLGWTDEAAAQSADDLVTSALQQIAYRGAPDLTDVLMPMLDAARRRASLQGRTSELDEAARAHHILTALRRQTWTPVVEDGVLAFVLDPLAHPDVRIHAARTLIGRLSKDGRERLVVWLAGRSDEAPREGDQPAARKAPTELQANVGRAIGYAARGEDAAALSAHLLRVLRAEHEVHFAVPERLDPTAPRDTTLARRARALALGIVLSKDPTGIEALVDLLFATPYRTYAARAAEVQARNLRRGGPGGGLRTAASVRTLLHLAERSTVLLPHDALQILEALRLADRDTLRTGLESVLHRHRQAGTLADLPDPFLHVLDRALAPSREGRGHEIQDLVAPIAARLLPSASAVDWVFAAAQVEAALRTGGAAALTEARDRLRSLLPLITQRGLDDIEGLLRARAEARLELLEGWLHAEAGEPDAARARFRSAALRAPYDPMTRMRCAVVQARAGFEVEAAVGVARRAFALHRRTHFEPSVPLVSEMAEVLVAAGHAAEAVDRLETRLEGKSGRLAGRPFVGLAEAYRKAGLPASHFDRAWVYALAAAPGLLDEARRHPLFSGSKEAEARLRRVIRRARTARADNN